MAKQRTLKVTIVGDSSSAKRAFREAEGSAGRFAGAVKTGAKAGTLAVAAFSAKSVVEFAGFEKGMNEVFTLLPNISGDAMDEMSDQVLDIAKDFGVMPAEVIPALYQALSAGVPPGNVFEFMETAIRSSIGGVTNLETSVDGITSVVNAFGSEVITAAEASDVMFTTVRLGKTTFDELAERLFQVNPVAAGLGVTFGEVGAAMAALTAQGVPTRVAATQIRTAMLELGKEGTTASDIFQEITGQTFPDFIAGGGTFADALNIMRTHADDMDLSVIDLFSSVEAGNAALALTSEQGAQAFQDALAEMDDSSGATQAAFERMDQGLSRTWDKIKATATVTMVEVGDTIVNAVAAVKTFWDEHFDAIKAKVDEIWPPIQETIVGVVETIRVIVDAVITAVKVIWSGAHDEIETTTRIVWDAIKGIVGGTLLTIKGIIDTVTALIRGDWSAAWTGIKLIFEGVWRVMSATVRTLFNAMKLFISSVGSVIAGIWDALWGRVRDTFKGAWESIVDVVRAAWRVISDIVNAVVRAVDRVITKIKSIPDAIPGGGFIPDIVKNVILGPLGPLVPFAAGGVVTKPTMALIGESGPEAVVPLNQAGGLGGPTTIVVNLSGEEVARVLVPSVRRGLLEVDMDNAGIGLR